MSEMLGLYKYDSQMIIKLRNATEDVLLVAFLTLIMLDTNLVIYS
jgi:hypothetical protein